MSWVTLYQIKASGEVHHLCELHNNHRGAPLFWNRIAERHGCTSEPHPMLMSDDEYSRLWMLAEDPVVDTDWRVVLACTFDGVLIRRADMKRISEAFGAFGRGPRGQSIEESAAWDGGHAKEICRLLSVIDSVAEPDMRGVCWNWCSAVESPWWIDVDEDDCDEEREGRPLNVTTDLDTPEKHFLDLSLYGVTS